MTTAFSRVVTMATAMGLLLSQTSCIFSGMMSGISKPVGAASNAVRGIGDGASGAVRGIGDGIGNSGPSNPPSAQRENKIRALDAAANSVSSLKKPVNAAAGSVAGIGSAFGGLLPFGGNEAAARDSKPESKPKTPRRQSIIGTLRFAYDGFALIYAPDQMDLPTGARLSTLDKAGVPQPVELKLSPERQGQFLVADIIQGEPRSGHLVVLEESPVSEDTEVQMLP